MNPIVVSKFGGTSVRNAPAMRRAAAVAVRQQSSLIVVSATAETTDDLLILIERCTDGRLHEGERIIQRIESRHRSIASELGVSVESFERLEFYLTELRTLARGVCLLRECSARAMDRILSIGEFLSSSLFVSALASHDPSQAVEFFDVRTIMRTDDRFTHATPLPERIRSLAHSALPDLSSDRVRRVTQGFIGRTEEGETTTLGRGGSDYSASLIAEAVGAARCEIWTDVMGISTTDPRLCREAALIEEMSFEEAAEMATFGAKVLHPTTIAPARRAGIPVFVGSTFSEEFTGTWIRESTIDKPLVRAIAIKKGQAVMTLSTPRMLHAYGFLASVFDVFARHKVSIDAVTTSEISVAMTMSAATTENRRLLRDLSELGDVGVEREFSLVTLIGNGIHLSAGLSAVIFEACSDINVRMICQGASPHNFCFLVPGETGDEVVSRLHERFFERRTVA